MFQMLIILSDAIFCVLYILSVVLFKNCDCSCEYQDWDVMVVAMATCVSHLPILFS